MRKFTTVCSLIIFGSVAVMAQQKKAATPAQSSLDTQVDALIARMTLEEKVGQMTEVTLDVISKADYFSARNDPELEAHLHRVSRDHWGMKHIQDAWALTQLLRTIRISYITPMLRTHGVIALVVRGHRRPWARSRRIS